MSFFFYRHLSIQRDAGLAGQPPWLKERRLRIDTIAARRVDVKWLLKDEDEPCESTEDRF